MYHPLGKEYSITSPFGSRIHPISKKKNFHSGIDYAAPMGTALIAVSHGKVIESRTSTAPNGGYGEYVTIQFRGFKGRYAHLSTRKVQYGDHVTMGDVIGLSGSSGNSTGPHLHFEIIKGGSPVDPEKFLTEKKATYAPRKAQEAPTAPEKASEAPTAVKAPKAAKKAPKAFKKTSNS